MAQLFSPRTALLARVLFVIAPLLALFLGSAIVYAASWSDWDTHRFTPVEQPVPFSHEHHVGGLGIDCRYCHVGVENSPFAGLPTTEVCMTCHSQMWTHAPMLDSVRESWANRTPLQWIRVHDLPDYVYFDHSIHVSKGVGCSTCHGDVSAMPVIVQVVNLQMRWCIDCHREPQKHLRPPEEIFNPRWQEPADQLARGSALAEEYHVRADQLTNCSICHR